MPHLAIMTVPCAHCTTPEPSLEGAPKDNAALPSRTLICMFGQCRNVSSRARCQSAFETFSLGLEVRRILESARDQLASGISDNLGDAIDAHD